MLALHLSHSRILWADEDYHLAAGIQTLHRKLPYRDFWYDKPPLAAWVYAALGGWWGWPLRLFDAAYLVAACAALSRLWGQTERFRVSAAGGQTERFLSAGLLAFFLSFDHAAAVIPIAPDLFMLLPHILAVDAAWRGRPFQAGLWSGIAFLFNIKGAFVLLMCVLLSWRNLAPLLAGFLAPNAAVLATLAAEGALASYVHQVWQWGIAYAGRPSAADSISNALRRLAGWLGFHAVLVIGATAMWWKDRSRGARWIVVWCLLSLAGVSLGGKFFPRYFFQLLPPLTLAASRGLSLLYKQRPLRYAALVWTALGIAALVPLIRFGPRYVTLAADLATHRPHQWSDVALDQDSQAAAAEVDQRKQAGDTLFVWGYRPDVFVYTRLPAGSLFWDSQPLTGVPADRHLFDSRAILPDWAARNRISLTASHPTFVVDGLSMLNPRLDIHGYPELREWLKNYREVARTQLSVIYQLADR